MSIQALVWVIENSQSRLAARHVLISIANHAKADGTGAWPSYETIAHEAGIDRSYVKACLDELVELGELTIESGAGPRGCNFYSLARMQPVETFNQLNLSAPVVESVPSTSLNFQPEPSLTVNEPSILSEQTLNSIERKAQKKEAKKQAKLAAERAARSGKRANFNFGRSNVQEKPARSRGEEARARRDAAFEILRRSATTPK